MRKSPAFAGLFRQAETPGQKAGRFWCWHRPIFPGRLQPSIFGADELNFRVRDGNGCTLIAIDTNYPLHFWSASEIIA